MILSNWVTQSSTVCTLWCAEYVELSLVSLSLLNLFHCVSYNITIVRHLDIFRIHVVAVRSIVKRNFVVNDVRHWKNNSVVVPAIPVFCNNSITSRNSWHVGMATFLLLSSKQNTCKYISIIRKHKQFNSHFPETRYTEAVGADCKNAAHIFTQLSGTQLSEDLSGWFHHTTFQWTPLDLRVAFVFLQQFSCCT